MPTFSYHALDRSGKEIHGDIDAAREELVIERLRALGYFPTAIAPARTTSANLNLEELPGIRQLLKLISRGKVNREQLTMCTRQLATLIGAGLPLMRSLEILQRQTTSANLKEALAGIAQDLENGAMLSEAMGKYPRIFNRLYLNMIHAGEVSGSLEQVLDRLAIFAEKSADVSAKVKTALFYPTVVIVIAAVIVGVILVLVVPAFQAIFNELNAPLPVMTQVLITCSDVLLHRMHYAFGALVMGVAGYRGLRRCAWGRFLTDWFCLKLPVLGNLFQKSSVARFARTFATLLDTGVPLLQALTIVRDTTGNELMARAVQDLHDAVREGETIANPLKQSPIFPPMVVDMVAVGEETGAIDTMLLKVAEAYEREVDHIVDRLSKLIEPVLMLVLGGIIGFIVVALYLPYFQVTPHL